MLKHLLDGDLTKSTKNQETSKKITERLRFSKKIANLGQKRTNPGTPTQVEHVQGTPTQVEHSQLQGRNGSYGSGHVWHKWVS